MSSEGGHDTSMPAATAVARTASLSSTTIPTCRTTSGAPCSACISATNWSPMSTNAIDTDRLRSSSGPNRRSQNASASSTEPTASATWLIPTSATARA
jgi:hypothetical protein